MTAAEIRTDLHERHSRVLPDWTKLYYDTPLEPTTARGHVVTDREGNDYLDCFGGILTTIVGYAPEQLREAIDQQLARGIVHTSTLYLIRSQVLLAERIAARSGIPDARVFFTNSGTEANDTALLLATTARSRNTVVALEGSYHGRSIACLAVTHLPTWKPTHFSPFEVVFAPNGQPADQLSGQGNAEELIARLDAAAFDEVAACILEPVQGVNGFWEPPPGLIRQYHRLLAERGALLISDEVQTGWGRTGSAFWGIQRHGVEPDLLTFAKGIGNGFTLGGVVAPAAIMNSLDTNSISTFGGNPLSTTAGLAVLDLIEQQDLQANAERQGDQILRRLRAEMADVSEVGQIRGAGLMIGIEMVDHERPAPNGRRGAAPLS